MTNSIKAIIPKEHHKLLKTQHFAMLTTVRPDGMLSTNPVGFFWDGEKVCISTLKSRMKYKNLKNDSRVALCVQSFSNPMHYIELRGHASLEDDADRAYFRRQFMSGSNGVEPPEDIDLPGAERALITISPTKVSAPKLYGGRFHNDDKDATVK
jgi:PPOX class probable F420-dependent enzyme